MNGKQKHKQGGFCGEGKDKKSPSLGFFLDEQEKTGVIPDFPIREIDETFVICWDKEKFSLWKLAAPALFLQALSPSREKGNLTLH